MKNGIQKKMNMRIIKPYIEWPRRNNMWQGLHISPSNSMNSNCAILQYKSDNMHGVKIILLAEKKLI